ncbi:MAG: diguanylate cyclase [Agitococcus sp.]
MHQQPSIKEDASLNPPPHHNIAYITQILTHKKFTFFFPKELERQFIAKRAAESQAFINTGRYLLITLFLIIVINATFYFQDIVLANNYQIIKDIYIPISLAITFILFSPMIASVRRHFYYFMTPCAILILYNIIVLVLHFENDYGEMVTYHLMMAIILMAFGLRFVLPLFIAILMTAGILGVSYAHFVSLPINYVKFSNYYILYGCVVAALTAISEWHERLAFLQSLLLDHHSEELNLLNKELERIAHEDALTGIANRRSFDDMARKEWDRALRDKQPLSLLLIDVDYFKRFNDFYGHSAGDICLQKIGQALQQSVMRSSDIVARYGGEEFIILLPNTKDAGGIEVATRIIDAVDALNIPHQQSDTHSHVSISVGVSTLVASPNLSIASLIHQADVALYKAKEMGRHQYVVYEELLPKPKSPPEAFASA